MANLSLIDFQIGLYIKGNVTDGQNKFEVHTYQFAQNGHQLAQIGQMPLWQHGHYLAIFHPILTLFFL